jgi:hypothetical protein
MKMNLLGYEISITVCNMNPEKRVAQIIRKRMIARKSVGISRKIEMIKILREPDISKILIAAGIVPADEIRYGYDKHDRPYVGLKFAKEWIDSHFDSIIRQ